MVWHRGWDGIMVWHPEVDGTSVGWHPGLGGILGGLASRVGWHHGMTSFVGCHLG